MTKNQTMTVTTILIVCAGITVILLKRGEYLPDNVGSTILLVLIIVSGSSRFVVDHFYKKSETQQDEASTSSQA